MGRRKRERAAADEGPNFVKDAFDRCQDHLDAGRTAEAQVEATVLLALVIEVVGVKIDRILAPPPVADRTEG